MPVEVVILVVTDDRKVAAAHGSFPLPLCDFELREEERLERDVNRRCFVRVGPKQCKVSLAGNLFMCNTWWDK